MGSAVLSPSSRLEKRNASSTISVTETEGMEPTGKPGKELRVGRTTWKIIHIAGGKIIPAKPVDQFYSVFFEGIQSWAWKDRCWCVPNDELYPFLKKIVTSNYRCTGGVLREKKVEQ